MRSRRCSWRGWRGGCERKGAPGRRSAKLRERFAGVDGGGEAEAGAAAGELEAEFVGAFEQVNAGGAAGGVHGFAGVLGEDLFAVDPGFKAVGGFEVERGVEGSRDGDGGEGVGEAVAGGDEAVE